MTDDNALRHVRPIKTTVLEEPVETAVTHLANDTVFNGDILHDRSIGRSHARALRLVLIKTAIVRDVIGIVGFLAPLRVRLCSLARLAVGLSRVRRAGSESFAPRRGSHRRCQRPLQFAIPI